MPSALSHSSLTCQSKQQTIVSRVCLSRNKMFCSLFKKNKKGILFGTAACLSLCMPYLPTFYSRSRNMTNSVKTPTCSQLFWFSEECSLLSYLFLCKKKKKKDTLCHFFLFSNSFFYKWDLVTQWLMAMPVKAKIKLRDMELSLQNNISQFAWCYQMWRSILMRNMQKLKTTTKEGIKSPRFSMVQKTFLMSNFFARCVQQQLPRNGKSSVASIYEELFCGGATLAVHCKDNIPVLAFKVCQMWPIKEL